ncbi:PAS domain-containing sensor histidine kinase [Propionivibrio sp.]|uniref:PAS domain-containing sensor histidine kinase n=1 Tax=Propionivibrio sp. TaxID=2212460 RepID=UPI003BF0E5DF
MDSKDNRAAAALSATSGLALRQRAESIFREKSAPSPDSFDALSPEASRQMLHELSVHQIELEMQNEELRRAHEELRRAHEELDASRACYVDLYDLAPVGYCTVSENGLILQANLNAATLLGVNRGQLVKRPIFQFIFSEDQDIYYLHNKQLIATGEPQSCELRMAKQDGTPFWAHLEAISARDDDGAPVLRIVLNDITVRKQAEEQLREMALLLEEKVNDRTKQLRAVSAQLSMLEERERRLLALELHDNLCQLLAAIKIKLNSLGADSPRPSVNQIVRLVDEADLSARMITLQLSPPILHTFGLMPALEWLAEEDERRYGLVVQFDNKISCMKPINYETRALLYRSVRELLFNIVKHAQVSDAGLSCLCHNQKLVLIVSDNGCGFDAANFPGILSGQQSFGLSSIYQRITNIGGEMDIESRPGNGTTVTLTVPCRIAEEESRIDPDYSCR